MARGRRPGGDRRRRDGGCGSTIIDRTIPFDLNGDAELRFDLLGVQARFVVPANYVQFMQPAAKSAEVEVDQPGRPNLGGTALIVEDNLIIALSAEVDSARTRRAPRGGRSVRD